MIWFLWKFHNLFLKYNMSCVWCLLVFVAPELEAQGFSGKYPIQNFTPTEYKAGIQNIDFAQNRDMTLFVANNLGVLSFNGSEWERHDFQTGKKKRSLAFDEGTNRLYVGSQGEFGYFEENWKYVSLIDKIPEGFRSFDEVWDVYLANTKVYFCTFQGIYVYDGQSITVIERSGGFDRSFFVNGKLFTQTNRGQLLAIEGLQLVSSFPQDQSQKIIAGLIPHEEGYLIFYNSGEIEFTTPLGVSRRYDNLIKSLQGTYVNHVLQLSDTRLAISTQTSGLFLYDLREQQLEKISSQNGLAANACLRSFQDYYGNLWVGMQNGIALIHINSPMRLLSREIDMEGSGYEAYETEAGTYFTTSNGIYFLAKNQTKSVFLPGTEGPAYGLQEIAGKLYAGHHTGLFMLENGKATYLAATDGLWKVKQSLSKAEYAIGGTYSGLYLFRINDQQVLEPVQPIGGFDLSSRFFEEDQPGNIWVGQYYKGLFQLQLSEDMTQAQTKNLSEEADELIREQIILSRVSDDFYLATNAGLYQLDPTNNSFMLDANFSDYIGKQPVYLFEQDRKNNVHVLTENLVGFFKQVSNGNYRFMPSSLYQLRYHLNNDLLQASINTNHGILFSANEGFIHYDPELEDPLKGGQPLVVNRVFSVTENRTLYLQQPFTVRPESIETLEISPSARVLKIDVESFHFNDLDNAKFRYFLKGFDEDFGAWTNSNTKEYTNLREGSYEFVAQTRNYLGEIATSQRLYLKVHPPFYRSTLAKYLYLIAGILVLVLVSRIQKRRYKQKARKIEEAKQLELAKKQQKLVEVEQQKEKELLQLKEEKMQSELQHVNKLLAASTMNLVVKNEFIESIREELKELKQSGRKSETKRALEKMVKEIDITLKLQEDWEQFEYHFEQVHGDFLSRLQQDYPSLSPNEQKLCTLLRLNLSTKEIANLLSISLRGVEVARYRLRKKLDLEKGQNLSKFILEY